MEKLEEVIPSINSRITSLINNSISREGVSSLINNSMIKFGDQENSMETLKTKVDDVGAQLSRKLTKTEELKVQVNQEFTNHPPPVAMIPR